MKNKKNNIGSVMINPYKEFVILYDKNRLFVPLFGLIISSVLFIFFESTPRIINDALNLDAPDYVLAFILLPCVIVLPYLIMSFYLLCETLCIYLGVYSMLGISNPPIRRIFRKMTGVR
mgnify:CR=1 FL=1